MNASRPSRIWNRIFSWQGVALGIAAMAYATALMFSEGFYLSGRGDPAQLDAGYMPVVLVTGLALLGFGLINLWLRR